MTSYRVKRGDGTDRTPFRTQWYVVDERGNTGMEGRVPRSQRRGHDRKREAEQSRQRLQEQADTPPLPSPEDAPLTEKDQRVIRLLQSGAVEYLRVEKDVPKDQAKRLEAHGVARRETRDYTIPGQPRVEYEVLVPAP